jgi:hypothetical protein
VCASLCGCVTNDHYVCWFCSKESLFAALKRLATAETITEFEVRQRRLRAGEYYTQNPKLAKYLESEWFTCVDIWAKCYRMVSARL